MSSEAERTVFGAVAERYERARPSYPREAVEWLVGPGPLVVLELGAGTGKLTHHVRAIGHDVLATDPDPRMLRLLEERVPDVRTAVGGAEEIALPDRSVDVVVCGQSFHWFHHAKAVPEIARVLRPEGHLALVWNVRDETTPWVRRLGNLIGRQDQEIDPLATLGPFREFGYLEERQFRHWHDLDRGRLLDLVASRSNIAVLSDDARAEVLARVGALYDDYARGSIRLPYRARCFRTAVRHRPPLEDLVSDEAADVEPEGPPEDDGTLLIDFR